jgi:aspartate/methionine/tyrosine aminotransferase
MQFHSSKASFSAIVSIGETIKKQSQEEGVEYLMLNRGVNSVVPVKLQKVVEAIDFNTPAIQVYPPARGRQDLKEAINQSYFRQAFDSQNILITGGGMPGLDLVFQTIDTKQILLPQFFWGSYYQILTIRRLTDKTDFYDSYEELEFKMPTQTAVVICDPNNPLGNKYDDERLFNLIKQLNDHDNIVIFDSPYRRIFNDETDDFFQRIGDLENVIIVESFSKSLGLSGQRIGFLYNKNKDLMDELAVRLMYSTNGINGFAQELVWRLLATSEGQDAVRKFKILTIDGIKKNISFLESKQFLATEFYTNSKPQGIFAIVNRSQEELLKHRIGSVALSYFTKREIPNVNRYARINISVPHGKLVRYFMALLDEKKD